MHDGQQQQRNLIYDLGAHTGEDTDFYLGKGFRVVAVEANPALAQQLHRRFRRQVRDGRLVVIDRAIGVELPPNVKFFVNEAKNDWSALDLDTASKGAYDVTEVSVRTIALAELFARYGVPYYLKVDIEGWDLAIAEALAAQPYRPAYVSFEWHETRLIAVLDVAGYRSFQMVNQYLKGITQQSVPAQEGTDYWPGPPTGTSSGVFGRELPEDGWVGFDDVMAQRLAYRSLLDTPDLSNSWFDLHAQLTHTPRM